MSNDVSHNLLSCFHSQSVETPTAAVELKVAPPVENMAEVKKNFESGNWSLIHSTAEESVEHAFITHYRPSFSRRLSAKSLELCTENLGSESCSDISSTDCSGFSIFSSTSSSSFDLSSSVEAVEQYSSFNDKEEHVFENPKHALKSTTPTFRKKKTDSSKKPINFPPPLTSMTGPRPLQMRRHRDGERLIIEAVEAPFRNCYLQAERSDGRLRLSFLTAASSPPAISSGEDQVKSEQIQEEEHHHVDHESANHDESEPKKEEFFDGEVNVDTGMEKFQRLMSRCTEGCGHGSRQEVLCCDHWKPAAFWVATS